MDRLVVAPKIVVYKNVFNDIKNIFDLLKETEGYTERNGLVDPWNDWAGNWLGRSVKIENDFYTINDSDSDDLKRQKSAVNEIRTVFLDVFSDYMSMYKEDSDWPYFVDEWDDFSKLPWGQGDSIDVLKYNKDQPEGLQHHPVAMNYHTDYNNFDEDSEGEKLVVTITVYLNNDYEGGEISLYDPNTEKVYHYKPKAGDVTVFPSGMNYYHGVLPFTGNDRYLLRMFRVYYHEGADSWHKSREVYGADVWAEMERKRLEDVWRDGKNLVNMVFPGKTPFNNRIGTIYVKEDPIFIDGTKDA